VFDVHGKVWGRTAHIFAGCNVEVHRIEVEPGGFCSKHRHRAKANLFFVESGELTVRIWRQGGGRIDETVLRRWQSCTVEPGVFHQFAAAEDTVAFEIYWVELDPGDILRETPGGMKP